MFDLLVTILALMAAYYVGSIFLPMLTGALDTPDAKKEG